jgi:hypothetical protein
MNKARWRPFETRPDLAPLDVSQIALTKQMPCYGDIGSGSLHTEIRRAASACGSPRRRLLMISDGTKACNAALLYAQESIIEKEHIDGKTEKIKGR